MAKLKTMFVCQNCGAKTSKWSGKCDNCQSWNSLVEEIIEQANHSKNHQPAKTLKAKKLTAVKNVDKARIKTGFAEIDQVLGGGILVGGVILLAGQPGIGKSTLLMQLAGHITAKQKVLYISGEESFSQVAMRGKRLLKDRASTIDFIASTSVTDIAATIIEADYDLVIIDSIQTMRLADLRSAPGSVSQITNSTNVLIEAAKSSQTAMVIVGHVTKEGNIAGPKVLEHLVDVVLQFEGDRYDSFKTIRAIKNRYGSTDEIAILEMGEMGLKIVNNPSEILLKERSLTDGSIILATMEGNQPLLVEIQALVNPTNFGYPKRTASGFDVNRLNLLIAVLEQRTKLKLSDKDVFVNVVGGVKLKDSAADLAVIMAIASAMTKRKLSQDTIVFGEVGLGGEIRSVSSIMARIKEAKKMGFVKAIAPKGDSKTKFIEPVKDLRQILIKYLEK